jgi:hypothetical protein
MVTKKMILGLLYLTLSFAYAAPEFDKSDQINGVIVQSGKDKGTRVYQGKVTKTFSQNLDLIKHAIINFTEKCNNSYKNRRKYTSRAHQCKHHNDNLVETQILRDLKNGWKREKHEVDRFVLARQVFNRGSFYFYELVRIYEYQDSENKKVIKIVQTLLDDKEVSTFVDPLFKKDSAFEKTTSTFILTQLSDQQTLLNYEYLAETDHWILNKEVSVPQVFSSISKSINDLVKTVSTD